MKYRIKPLIKTMSYEQLKSTCKREGWLIPSVRDLRGSELQYDCVWTTDELQADVRTNGEKKDGVKLGIAYDYKKDKKMVMNKKFMIHCVVLVEVKDK